MGLAAFNRLRREQEEKAKSSMAPVEDVVEEDVVEETETATPQDHSDNGDYAVMKAGRKSAMKLFKSKDYEDPKASALHFIDELVKSGNATADELTLDHRS